MREEQTQHLILWENYAQTDVLTYRFAFGSLPHFLSRREEEIRVNAMLNHACGGSGLRWSSVVLLTCLV